jgi:DNA-3-methyladenine glycosylase
MRKILPRTFFDRPTLTVARELLGKYLVRRIGVQESAVMITEVEAYDGPFDRASHAFRGRTPRTTVMFGPAGVFYVYFTYGMHWMVNVVTGPKNYPAAVLIRSAEYADPETGGLITIKGPARLTKHLKITGTENKMPVGKESGLWFEDRGLHVPRAKIVAGKRVGVDYAGEIWAEKPYNVKIDIN